MKKPLFNMDNDSELERELKGDSTVDNILQNFAKKPVNTQKAV